ncbi:MAG: SIR2 family protein [Cyanobacteria bacterium REEB446]|nr:SIR2 family protein [Cyanobacteria bacterium REEB446]
MKEFNLLLGAGFSKALANISTGQEFSGEIFNEFDKSDDEQERSLVNFNYGSNLILKKSDELLPPNGTISGSFLINQKSIRPFQYLPNKDRMISTISMFNITDNEKEEHKNKIQNTFRNNFNYETAAKHLTNIIESAEIFGINSEKVESLSNILKKIKEEVFKITTKDPISWRLKNGEKQALNDFTFFLNYLLDQGYTINIFDLNHDQLIREIIKQGNLSEGYQDFFNRNEVIDVYKSDLKAYKFDSGLSKRRINHYKLHGDFQIIRDYYQGWALLAKFSATNKYTWSRGNNTDWLSLLTDSLLFQGEAKANSIFSSLYHSFAFTDFFKAVQSNEPLMIIGYGGGDSHINSVLDNRLKNHRGYNCVKLSRNGDKVLFSCNEFTETILKQVFINLQGDYNPNLFYSREGFEQGFLPVFRTCLKQYYV